MINARDIYEDEEYGWSSYQPIIDAIGKVAIQREDGDYQGDTHVLYGPERWGYLTFGWGSCSGCDALQGCSSMGELQELVNQFEDSVKWFDSKDEALKFFIEHDWAADYCCGDAQKQFVIESLQMLANRPTP